MITDVLREYVLYNGADRMVGRIDEFRPPELKVLTEEFRGAGMDTSVPIDMGMEPMEAGWTCSGIDRGTYTGFGIMTGLMTTVNVRGAIVNPITGISFQCNHMMMGKITAIAPGAWKAGERATLSATMRLLHYKLTHTIPGVPAIEIDVLNGIRNINGVDQLAALRVLVGR